MDYIKINKQLEYEARRDEALQKELPELSLEELKLWARSVSVREKEMEDMMKDSDFMRKNTGKGYSSEEMMKRLIDEKSDLERKLKKHGLTLFEVNNAFERTRGGMKDSIE